MCSSDLQEYLKPLLDHNPVFQLLDVLFDLELLAKLGQFCREAGIKTIHFPNLAELKVELRECLCMHANRDLETWAFCFSSRLEKVLINLLGLQIAKESFPDSDSIIDFYNWFPEWYYSEDSEEILENFDDYETFKQYVLEKFEEEREKWEEGSL